MAQPLAPKVSSKKRKVQPKRPPPRLDPARPSPFKPDHSVQSSDKARETTHVRTGPIPQRRLIQKAVEEAKIYSMVRCAPLTKTRKSLLIISRQGNSVPVTKPQKFLNLSYAT